MATPRVLVVGAGAVGLRTALELSRRKIDVIVRSPLPPWHPSTCSMGAGGLWMPFHCDDPRIARWSNETLDELLPMASDERFPVEIVPAVNLLRENFYTVPTDDNDNTQVDPTTANTTLPEWSKDPRINFQHLTVEMLHWQNQVHQFKIPPQKEMEEAGYYFAHLFFPPIVDSPKMLQVYMDELLSQSSEQQQHNVETGDYYESIDDLRALAEDLDCNVVVNCTGLGSAKICPAKNDDSNVVGGRGVLLQMDRHNCPRRRFDSQEDDYDAHENAKFQQDAVIVTEDPPWAPTPEEPCYMIPRGDTIVIGGCYQEWNDFAGITNDERNQLLKNATAMGIDIEHAPVVGEWTGFRPVRNEGVCCEIDHVNSDDQIKVLHNYGHGGSGWTINVGTAKEIASLVTSIFR